MRVGAFANRDAALSYAVGCPARRESAGTYPRGVDSPEDHAPRYSAPAELPLEEGDRIEVYSWGDSLALKGVPPRRARASPLCHHRGGWGSRVLSLRGSPDQGGRGTSRETLDALASQLAGGQR